MVQPFSFLPASQVTGAFQGIGMASQPTLLVAWMRYTSLFCLLLLLCLLSGGCTSKRIQGAGQDSGQSAQGTGKPYIVRGQTYRPYTTGHGYIETGVASWYGPGFHGKTTANGERYNQNAMTAAHKLLPFNTNIRVTNLSNGRSVVVRINDRGPFVASRVIDLSHEAARRLDMVQAGTARVRLEAVEGGKSILTRDGDMLGRFYVQIGAFKVKDNANRLLQTVRGQGLGGRVLYNKNSDLHNVQIGPYPSVDQADQILIRLRTAYPGLFVIAE